MIYYVFQDQIKEGGVSGLRTIKPIHEKVKQDRNAC